VRPDYSPSYLAVPTATLKTARSTAMSKNQMVSAWNARLYALRGQLQLRPRWRSRVISERERRAHLQQIMLVKRPSFSRRPHLS